VKEVLFAVPGDLASPTGGYSYDRRMIAGLAGVGWRTTVVELGEGFPFPPSSVHAAACARLAAQPAGQLMVVDGLAFGALPEAAAALRYSHRLVALVHHPLALETGLAAAAAETLRASERAALAHAHGVITTSAATARLLAVDFGVPAEHIRVVQPGTDRVAAPPRVAGDTLTLLSVGSVVPRKGFDVLVQALARLADLPWRLTIAGDRMRCPNTAREVDAAIARHHLGARIAFTGAVIADRLAALYGSADLFVLASRFEGYGMAYAEAIAHGLPVIGTTAGAIPEVVTPQAGVLVAPDDVEALTAALRHLMTDPQARAALAAGARAAAARLPTWSEQAVLFARALEQCR
jgi:glycosyltransferase involved in cell wall biosynthesis